MSEDRFPLAVLFCAVALDRSALTLAGLDNLMETLRERGYPEYRPKDNAIIVRYEVAPETNPMRVLERARQELLIPDCSYDARVAACLAADIRELRDEVDTAVRSMGFDRPAWSMTKAVVIQEVAS